MKIFNSTIFRLTLWYVAVLGVLLSVFAFGIYQFFGFVLTQQTDRSMTEIVNAFEKIVSEELTDKEDEHRGDIYKKAFTDAAVDVDFKDYQIIVLSRDNKTIVQTRASVDESKATNRATSKWISQFDNRPGANFKNLDALGQSYRVMHRPFRHNGETFNVLTVHNLRDQTSVLSNLRNGLLITVPIALLLASLGGYFLARKSFAPIARMTEKAEEITAKSLEERLPVQNSEDELGRLATTFNQLLGRLNTAFKQQQQFMADASHELRTPVAIVRGEAEVSLTKDSRTPAEYRETIEIVEKEAVKMSGIIEDLFMLARADAGENPVNKTAVYLEDIIENAVKSFRTIATRKDIDITFKSGTGMEVRADEYLLLRLFSNLIDNAVKHAKSKVKVSASSVNNKYVISVTDDGDGIPTESQPHIFERFYRADQARTRDENGKTGAGAGLGLAISKWIAEAHNSELWLKSSDSSGTVFIVAIPVQEK